MKHKQSFTDDILQKYDIFGRRIEVKNVFKGIETIATTFGFSGLDPNTALMGWARNTKDPIWFAQMTQKLIDLDYNVLYLDYDNRWGFRKREQIDLWWRGISNNAELMLHLAKFISVSPEWWNAKIRILLVNDYNVDRKVIENRIAKLLEEFRVQAEINVINNTVDRKPFYDLMKVVSADADLVFIGIPNIMPGEEASFVERTNNLVSIIGTTLLVKASSTFEVTKLGFKDLDAKPEIEPVRQLKLKPLPVVKPDELSDAIFDLDEHFEHTAKTFSDESLAVLQQHYAQFVAEIEEHLSALFSNLKNEETQANTAISDTLKGLAKLSESFREEELELLRNILSGGIEKFQKNREAHLLSAPSTLSIDFEEGKKSKRRITWKKSLLYYHRSSSIPSLLQAMYDLGMAHLSLLGNSRRVINRNLRLLQKELNSGSDKNETLEKSIQKMDADFKKLRKLIQEIAHNPFYHIRKTDREICHQLATDIPDARFNKHIAQKNRKRNRKKIKAIGAATHNFAQNWERNQGLLHRRFEVGLLLSSTATALKGHTHEAVGVIRKDFFKKAKKQLLLIESAIPEVRRGLEEKDMKRVAAAHIQLEDSDFGNPEQIMFRLTEAITECTAHLPEEVELMDAATFNTFNEEQGDGISVTALSIDKIAEFLIETNFVAPFQKKLFSFINEMNLLNGKIASLANLLNYGIDSADRENALSDLPEILKQTEKELSAARESAKLLFKSFVAEIEEKLEATESAMVIRSITERANQLDQYVRKERRRKGISARLQNLENSLQKNLHQVHAFVSQKKQDVALANFEKRHALLRGTPVILRDFVENVNTRHEVEEHLPFYYKQLFSGKHLNPGRKIDNRQREIGEATKAIRHIRSGIGGGIMVTGEALSGKSFFCEHVAYHLLNGSVFHITPPVGGSVFLADFQKAIQEATGKKGKVKSILQSLPKGTTFILGDIEMWWLKAAEGDQVIERLTKMIEAFGNRHFFLLNCNLQTYTLLSQTTSLRRCLVSTIILAPMSKEELQNVIWTRHKTGGLVMKFKGKPENEFSEKSLIRLFSRFLKLSGGQPGAALRLWLASIQAYHDDGIELKMPIDAEFPEIENANWKNLLLQLFLHKSISRLQLEKLYATESENWIDQMVAELRKSAIANEPLTDVFTIKSEILPYLERWLKEKEMI